MNKSQQVKDAVIQPVNKIHSPTEIYPYGGSQNNLQPENHLNNSIDHLNNCTDQGLTDTKICPNSHSPALKRQNSTSNVKSVEECSTCHRCVPQGEEKEDESEKEARCLGIVRTVWKTFYMTAWLAAAFFSIYNISLFVNRFFERPTQIVITSVKPDQDGLEFPTISICNMNKIENSFLDLNPTFKQVWDRLEASKVVNWKNETAAEIGRLTYSDVYANSFGWQRAVDQCKYGGWLDCDELDYHKSELFADDVGASGKCYTFNPQGTVFSKSVGNEGCFRFLMNVHRAEYPTTVPEVGFIVDIHHHTTFQGSSKIEMSPGYKYRVGIKPKIRVELEFEAGGECDPARNVTSYLAYDADSCEYECRDRYINSTCGCIISAPPNNRYNYPTCSIKQMEDCGWVAYYHFLTRDENMPNSDAEAGPLGEEIPTQLSSTSSPPVTSTSSTNRTVTTASALPQTPTGIPLFVDSKSFTCSGSCPPACYKRYFDIVVSSSKISARNAKILAEQIGDERGLETSAEFLLKNHVLMEFYLADSFTELIASVPAYTLWNLLSDIGGVMGLFLGASIFSFFAFCKATVIKIRNYNNTKEEVTFCMFLKGVLNLG